jgi:hypothetical protein
MRPHLFIAGLVLLAAAGWYAIGPDFRSEGPIDRRESFLAAGPIAVAFTTSHSEGYEFIWLGDSRWTWERVSRDGTVGEDAIVHDGSRTLLRIASGCWIEPARVAPPFVPGLTAARDLRAIGHEQGEGTIRYELDPSAVAPLSRQATNLTVLEDPEHATGNNPHLIAWTSGDNPSFWYGNYEFRPASQDAVAQAHALLAEARATPFATMEIRERVLSTVIGSLVVGPYPLVVAEGCPDHPVTLRPASRGGQLGGPRVVPSNLALAVVDGRAVARASVVVPGPIHESPADMMAAARVRTPRDIPIEVPLLIATRYGDGGWMAVRISDCTPAPFFPCTRYEGPIATRPEP